MCVVRFRAGKNSIAPFLLTILLIISVLVYLNIPVLRDNAGICESVLLLLISAIVTIRLFVSRPPISITAFELAYASYILISITKQALLFNLTIIAFVSLLFPALLYYGIRSFLITIDLNRAFCSLLGSIVTLAIAYVTILIFGNEDPSIAIRFLFSPNASVFGILLSAQLAFLFAFLICRNKQKRSSSKTSGYLIYTIAALLITLLIRTNGRAGWLGFIISHCYSAFRAIFSKRWRKIFQITVVVGVTFLLPLLLLYKSASSAGRMLIYKISFQIFRDNWLAGIGTGQFKEKYNLYQANYFQHNGIDSTEALLADTTFYAFNDLLQLLIECGIISFVPICIAWGLLLLELKRVANKLLLLPYYAAIISIGTGSLFFYPFHIFSILFLMIYCVSIINSQLADTSIRISNLTGKVCKIIFILTGLLFTIHFYIEITYKIKSKSAAELARAGFKNEALHIYEHLSYSYIRDGNTMLQYATELYSANKIKQSFDLLQAIKRYYPTNEVYKLSAASAKELHLFKQAEKDYLTAIYMVPNRVTSRFELFQYYLSAKDTSNAIYWGRSILNMKIKIPSETTTRLLNQTDKDLKMITGKDNTVTAKAAK